MKTLLRPSVFVCLSIVLGASVAAAHHAVQAQFDVNDVQPKDFVIYKLACLC